MHSERFTERMVRARKNLALTQAEVADRAGLQCSAVSLFETGARKPSFENFCRLCDALEVSADYLIGRRSESIQANKFVWIARANGWDFYVCTECKSIVADQDGSQTYRMGHKRAHRQYKKAPPVA